MRTRRGLSTVVGTVFFIIAATTVISYISSSMDRIDQFSQSVIVADAENINRGIENIKISSVSIDDDKFNITVVNTGSLPVHLTRLWVTNGDSALPDNKVDLDVRINPGSKAIKIGQSNPSIPANTNSPYTLKIVTERGNLASHQVFNNLETRIKVISPASVLPDEKIQVTALYINNSTVPNTITDLTPTIQVQGDAIQVGNPDPIMIKTLRNNDVAVVTWQFNAPSSPEIVTFNASFANSPKGAWGESSTDVAAVKEMVGSSQWSEFATRVGVVISGVPGPIDGSGDAFGKFGMGVINPLDRNIEVYAMGIVSPSAKLFVDAPTGVEPTTGWRSIQPMGEQSLLIWEGGSSPIIIPPKEIKQFKVLNKVSLSESFEGIINVIALTSEGKMTASYNVSVENSWPLINVFYTGNPSNPETDWGYLIKNVPQGKNDQILNVTVQNSSIDPTHILTSEVRLIILVPKDFTDVKDVSNCTGGWNCATISINQDNTHTIKVDTSATAIAAGSDRTFQFSVDVPSLTQNELYVFRTATIYPSWTGAGNIQLASAFSEATMEVVP